MPTRILPCGHAEYANGHCAEMSCIRYVSKCPSHDIIRSGQICSVIRSPDPTIRQHVYVHDGIGPAECTFTELTGERCGLPVNQHVNDWMPEYPDIPIPDIPHNDANTTCPGPGIKCVCWDIANSPYACKGEGWYLLVSYNNQSHGSLVICPCGAKDLTEIELEQIRARLRETNQI